jgi:hypothetical protein
MKIELSTTEAILVEYALLQVIGNPKEKNEERNTLISIVKRIVKTREDQNNERL